MSLASQIERHCEVFLIGGGNGEKSATDLTDRGILDWRCFAKILSGMLPSTH